jgi:hypothetical protein
MAGIVTVIGLGLVVFGVVGYGIFGDAGSILYSYTSPTAQAYCVPSPCPAGVTTPSVDLLPARVSSLLGAMLVWALLLPGVLILAGVALVLVDRRLATKPSA